MRQIGSLEEHLKHLAKEDEKYNSAIISDFKKETKNLEKREFSIIKSEEKEAKALLKTLQKKEKEAAKKIQRQLWNCTQSFSIKGTFRER